MNKLSSQILVDIINHEMDMPKNTVWLRDQNKTIPNDNGLYIAVGIVSAITMANNTYMEERTINNQMQQWQINQVNQEESIQVDLLSHANAGITRNWEVIAALQSFYSQQQQELNNFKILRIPRTFINTSSAEGGYIINRYTIVITMMVWYRKEKLLSSPLGDYYDDFKARVDDEETIDTDTPLIDFEINQEGIVP